jgi:polysaccharide deacetylase 2 family uncharacterized protein YibQ
VDDELSAPLGQGPGRKRRTVPKIVPTLITGLLGAIVLGFAAWTALVDDPLGGEPVVVVSATPSAPEKPKAAPAAASAGSEAAATVTKAETSIAAAPAAPTVPPGAKTITIIDGMSGKREQVVVGSDSEAKTVTAPTVRDVAAPAGAKSTATANAKTTALDDRLVETSRHGTIPKVAADGTRAAEIYAQPVPPAKGPRIAIVVGRLGISANATTEALAKLPGPVTFAFAPYATDVDRWAARARGESHEVLLQVPMEPHDYPDNDPGPQTLLTTLKPEENIDRLQWAMSRIQGYVGISNYMGAKFGSNEPGVSTVMQEAGKRGLIYFDDGAASRGVASQVAAASNVPFAKADVTIDAAPTAAEIDGALAKLEAVARERGVAVGVATALPISIQRISTWAKAVTSRGITLVPISAIANKPKQS